NARTSDAVWNRYRVRGRAWLAGASGERHDVQGERAAEGARCRDGLRRAGVRRRFRTRRRCARRRARYLLGPLGGSEQGLSGCHAGGRRQVAPARLRYAQRTQGAIRVRALPRLARWPRGGVRRYGPGHSGLAPARRERLRLRSDVFAGRARAYIRRDDARREAWSAARGQRTLAPRPRVPEAGGGLSCQTLIARLRRSASTSIGHSAYRSARIATSTAMCGTLASMSRVSRAPSPPKSPQPLHAYPDAPSPRFSSAAARRR